MNTSACSHTFAYISLVYVFTLYSKKKNKKNKEKSHKSLVFRLEFIDLKDRFCLSFQCKKHIKLDNSGMYKVPTNLISFPKASYSAAGGPLPRKN